MSEFYNQQKQKRKQSILGPWIQTENKPSLSKSNLSQNKQQQYHNFLHSIKYSKKSQRSKKKIQVEFTQPKQQYSSLHDLQQKHKASITNKIRFLQRDKKEKPVNPTLYFCNYKADQKNHVKLKNWSSVGESDKDSAKGSKNLQKLLKIKQKLRVKNSQYLQKVKEGTPILTERSNEELKLKMQGKRRHFKTNSIDTEIRKMLYRTLQSNAHQRNPKKLFFIE